jgi:penicillin amidase
MENGWRGFLEEARKPIILNPKEGYLITANNKIVPEDYPFYVSCDFDVPFRFKRIQELLLQQEKHSVDSLKRIQNDVYSKRAELFLPAIKGLNPADVRAKKAQAILEGWNGEMTAAKEAALFAVFMKTLQQDVFADKLGPEYKNYSILFHRKQAGLLRVLSLPVLPWSGQDGAGSDEAKEKVFDSSLAKAFTWLEERHGPPENWDWAKIHSLTFPHALGRVPMLGFFNRGPYPIAGDSFCIRASISQDAIGNYATTWGVSYRQIIDLADFRNSVCVLSSGQSGHPFSKHYDDQIPLWLKGEYRPMLFYPEDIEANAAAVFVLKASSNTK